MRSAAKVRQNTLIRGDASPYAFVSVEVLVADFLADVEQRRPE